LHKIQEIILLIYHDYFIALPSAAAETCVSFAVIVANGTGTPFLIFYGACNCSFIFISESKR